LQAASGGRTTSPTMRVEPTVFGAFYRRFEDEVLGYFLARGAKPEVAADLTAETFAAAMPSRSRKRLAARARSTLEASRREGRVVDEARRRHRMPPLALSYDSVTRIAALDGSGFARAPELRVDGQDDVRVRVIDESDFERVAADLRLSHGVRRTEAISERADGLRIPELEASLVAAVPPRGTRARGALALAGALAVGALAFLVFAQGSDDRDQFSPSLQLERTSSEKDIVRVGNGWAPTFAASGPESCVLDMTEQACARVVCEEGGDAIEHCVPLSRTEKSSFRGATVQEVVVHGDRAGARFSNGVIVEFTRAAPDSEWQVEVVGTHPARAVLDAEPSPRKKLMLNGNAWARFFAASGDRICVDHMTRSACERATCQGISGLAEDCTPVSPGFRHSFRDAVIKDVLVIRGNRAVARFSNGKIVEFVYVADGGGRWWVDRLRHE
jgi:hypothetical protein